MLSSVYYAKTVSVWAQKLKGKTKHGIYTLLDLENNL